MPTIRAETLAEIENKIEFVQQQINEIRMVLQHDITNAEPVDPPPIQMPMEVTQILLNAQALDSAVRKLAEKNLKQFEEQNLPGFLFSLAEELANDAKPPESRKLAGLFLKNALDSKEKHRKIELAQRWLSLDSSLKFQIKDFLFLTLSSLSVDARSTVSQVIVKVAGIELPHKQWPRLIVDLLSNINAFPSRKGQESFETLGYICEEVSLDVVEEKHLENLFFTVIDGMHTSEENINIRFAALRAFYNALGYAQASFVDEWDWNYIMQMVLAAARDANLKLCVAGFDCLIAIWSSYSNKLVPSINDILDITTKLMLEDDHSVVLKAIEFWNLICHTEIDLSEERGGEFDCIKSLLLHLVSVLLDMLITRRDINLDEGVLKTPLALGISTCLGLVAQTVFDDIVPLIVSFVEENISKPDWMRREAATYAIGSILKGTSCDKLVPFVIEALSFLLDKLAADPNNHVRATIAWTLGRMFEFLRGSALDSLIVEQANIQKIISILLSSMTDVPIVAEKACGALYFLARLFEGSASSPLNPYFLDIVHALLTAIHREDAGESCVVRTEAYEALVEVVRCSNNETVQLVLELVPVIVTMLRQTIVNQDSSRLRIAANEALNVIRCSNNLTMVVQHVNQNSSDEKQNEIQCFLIGCFRVIIQKLSSSETTTALFMLYTDDIMRLFLEVFASRSATIFEEAMLAIGALAYACGADFAKHMPEFYKYMELGLQNFEDYQVCAITVGVVGDVCRALKDKILLYCDRLMTQLLKDLSSNQLHRSVKPPIFSCFGDIALAIGENFENYLLYAMPMLQSAAELSAGADDDMTEYTNSLRNGILKAYLGILHGFKGSRKTQLLMPYVDPVLQFLDSLYKKDMDVVVMKTAIGVLGGLALTLGRNVCPLIQNSVSGTEFLKECLQSNDDSIKESAVKAAIALL